MEKIKRILIMLAEAIYEKKRVVLALSCLVVFITTYLLILPAFTLEADKAAEQGGIDVPEAVMEDTSEDKEEPVVQEGKTEVSKSDKQSDDSAEVSVREPIQYEGEGFTIAVEDPQAVLPEDTELVVEELLEKPVEGTKAERKAMEEAYKDYCDQAITAINDESKDEATKTISFAKLYDIKFMSSGEEITPDKPVNVTITYDKDTSKDLNVKALDNVHIVHFAEDKKTEEVTAELLDKKNFDVTLDKSKMTETTFEAENFSVYAVMYTVDFHYEVNGEKYKFGFGGGGTASMRELIRDLHIYETVDTEVADILGTELATETFLQDIEKVEFSDESLIKVANVTENTIAGELKESLGLKPEYSAELTAEDIKTLNAKKLTAPDWALISLKPFNTEETLTVTMKNGDKFTIRVTDAQDPLGLVGKKYIISYNNLAMIGREDHMTWLGGERYAFPNGSSKDEKAVWTFEYNENSGKYYLKAYDGSYFRFDWANNQESGNVKLSERNYASPLTIQKNPDGTYRIGTSDSNLISYYENGNNPAYFCGSKQGYGGPQSNLTLTEKVDHKNWLLYLDEDKTEITIGVGDSLTLRPYGEWYWKNDDQPDNLKSKNWTFNDGNWTIPNPTTDSKTDSGKTYTTTYYKTASANNGTIDFEGYSKWDDQLKEFYSVYHGIANKEGTFTLKNSAGKTITVHVVASSPEKPSLVTKTSNIAVNLFDYDKNKVLDPSDDSNIVGRLKNDTINQDKYGNLKFLSSGSGSQGSNINDYSYDRANGGILNGHLQTAGNNKGYPQLSQSNGGASLKYLFDTRNTNWGTYNSNNDSWSPGNDMIAYPNVEGLFQQDTDGFYYFNSNSNYAYYNGERIVLYDHTYTQVTKDTGVENGKPIGFFPFHDYDSVNDLYVNQNSKLNHHVGMSMDLDFEIPEDRKNNGKDIVYEFSGDDDMWVFIDDELVLDIGGIHQPVRGKIDFTNGKIYVYGKNTVTKTFNVGEHNMKVFYLERGGCDSNCSIKFNLPLYRTLDLSKRLNGLTAAEWDKYKNEEFTYELKVNGQLYNSPAGAADKQSLKAQRLNANGVVIEYFIIQNGQITIKHGETVRIPHLSPSDTFYVAEEKSLNMEQFEAPHAERDYYLVSDGKEHEEEIELTEGHTEGAATSLSDWYTQEYAVNDTEKVTFTNTLKEKDLEVEKKWIGEEEHPDSVKFTVQATVENEQGAPEPYTVAALKDGQDDKEFILNESNEWRKIIEHLPILSPEGKFITYHVTEVAVEGYISRVKDVTQSETRCNLDAMKLWPDSTPRTEVITVKLKNSEGKYYAGKDEHGNAVFNDAGNTYELKPENDYTQRFYHLLKDDTYTLEQVGDQDDTTTGLVTYERTIVDFDIENEPIGGEVNPPAPQENPEIHKRIDALRDKVTNPDSAHNGEDLTDLYRLYLDYKINSIQEPGGVDLLFVIDHSGSMNNNDWQGNRHRARSVMEALNGENGVIAEFLSMNDKNQWAAVGFKGADGAGYFGLLWDNPWYPFWIDNTNAGQRDSEVLSPSTNSFTRENNGVNLDNEGANILTNYTAGFWRAEQFLLNESVINDGKKKVVVFISDGIPTLHIPDLNGTLAEAGAADGSPYYRDNYGGCPQQTLDEFGYFVKDMKDNGYIFGDSMEFYTIGFGGSMQTETGSALLRAMLNAAYGDSNHGDNFMTISDVNQNSQYNNAAAQKLKENLRIITGMSEVFTEISIQDTLSGYVDLYGLDNNKSESEILKAAKAKVTMTDPSNPASSIVLYDENGIPNNDKAKFTKADGTKAPIVNSVSYDKTTKKVTVTLDPEYKAVQGVTYTLSFDVKTTDTAYAQYAEYGYDKTLNEEGEQVVIQGDADTDFLGTNPDNSTSSGKEGFHSNVEAKTSFKHNGEDKEKEYPHPVIQVFNAPVQFIKIDQSGAPLVGAKFDLYKDAYDDSGTDAAEEANAANKIATGLESKLVGEEPDKVAQISIEQLKPGTYYLVETDPPDGYNTIEPIEIVVSVTSTANNDGTTTDTVNLVATQGDESMASHITNAKDNNGVWKMEVMNTSGVELPHTGGIGTTIFYILGSILVIGSGIYFISRRRIAK